MKKTFLIVIIALVALATVVLTVRFGLGGAKDTWLCQNGAWVKHGRPKNPAPATGCGEEKKIANFAECAAMGNPVMESYPRQCRAGDETFAENIGNELEKTDLIRLSNPRPNQKITSPLVLSGEARGYWFFEASFPVNLYDADGKLLASGIATAQDNWMTENFVPFTATLNFESATDEGLLILKKDNPSDLPANDDQLEVPVGFR